MKELTNKQKVFVQEYLQCWNGAEAARRAGYAPKNARYQARDLLALPQVLAEIHTHLSESAMTANEALARLAEQARTNLGDYLQIEGEAGQEQIHLDVPRIIKEGKGHLIQSVRLQGGSVAKIELHDNQRALMLLARAFTRTPAPAAQETQQKPQKTIAEWTELVQERVVEVTKTISMWGNVGGNSDADAAELD